MTRGRLLLYLIALVAALAQARAAPLDADTCARLRTEQGQLEEAGIEKEMAKGPAWAKANVAPERLAQVRRFIELEELIVFRCRGKSLVTLPPEPEAAATGDQTEQEKPDRDEKETTVPKAPSPPPADKTKASAPKQKTDVGKTPPAVKPAVQPKKQDASQPKKQETTVAKKPPAKAARPPSGAAEGGPAKAKVDDAYKAPPPDPSVNPFADQLKLPARQP